MNSKEEIYYACERVRGFLSINAGVDLSLNPDSGAKKMRNLVQTGSLIYSLIKQSNWDELFGNKDWLSMLEAAQNLSCVQNDRVNPQLRIIAENFPEQTKTFIFPEIL